MRELPRVFWRFIGSSRQQTRLTPVNIPASAPVSQNAGVSTKNASPSLLVRPSFPSTADEAGLYQHPNLSYICAIPSAPSKSPSPFVEDAQLLPWHSTKFATPPFPPRPVDATSQGRVTRMQQVGADKCTISAPRV